MNWPHQTQGMFLNDLMTGTSLMSVLSSMTVGNHRHQWSSSHQVIQGHPLSLKLWCGRSERYTNLKTWFCNCLLLRVAISRWNIWENWKLKYFTWWIWIRGLGGGIGIRTCYISVQLKVQQGIFDLWFFHESTIWIPNFFPGSLLRLQRYSFIMLRGEILIQWVPVSLHPFVRSDVY
jgi:hypothetical protein